MALDPVSALLDIGGKVIDRIWPDPIQAANAKLELIKLQQNGELAAMAGQMDINKVEAANSSVFVSGWRPFIGWVCGAACAWNWIGLKALLFAAAYFNHPLNNLAPADLGEMMPVLMGMLGIGGLRTIEKINGVAAK
jgi:hypothetical protein